MNFLKTPTSPEFADLDHDLKVAEDSDTHPDVLSQLAESKDEVVAAAVAANPNTPESVLFHLWVKHPAALLKNPILHLWEFTEPGSLQSKIPPAALLSLYAHLIENEAGQIPENILPVKRRMQLFDDAMKIDHHADFDIFARDPSPQIRCLFIDPQRSFYSHGQKKVFIQPETILNLARDSDPSVVLALAEVFSRGPLRGNRYVSSEVDTFDAAARILFAYRIPAIDLLLSKASGLPPDLIDELSKYEEETIRENVSKLERAEIETHLRLCRDHSVCVRKTLAAATHFDSVQAIFLNDPSLEVRQALAASSHLTTASKESLLIHPDVETRVVFAARTSSPYNERFPLTENPAVLSALLGNYGTSDAIIDQIIENCPQEVQLGLLKRHKKLTREFYLQYGNKLHPKLLAHIARLGGIGGKILNELAVHPDPIVRRGVAKRLGSGGFFHVSTTNKYLVDLLVQDSDDEVREKMYDDRRLNKHQRLVLFRDKSPFVREKILRLVLGWLLTYRNCDYVWTYSDLYGFYQQAIVELASDPCKDVRLELATSREAPPTALGILFDDPDEEIRAAARRHERFPYGTILDLEKAKPRLKGKFIRVKAGLTIPSRDALKVLSKSRNPFLRYQVALHYKSGLHILRKLATDSHPLVRETAQARLQKRNPTTNQQ
jgi:hypothetical protein